ncbi:MAG: deoxyribonuclease IV [SAR202 cluster bacterium]|nr:deoxyribonuclease IV [SAR202 cluster bacterium]|tara:strand:- start:489 stop:1334 length:846 start_codon:yes stop_codon:yes gene_type:complete
MHIGGHVSTSGGIQKSIGRGVDIGAECIQIFASSPQSWAFKDFTTSQIQEFHSAVESNKMGPIFIHCIYLVNLGTPDETNLIKSITALKNAMNAAGQIGARGVVFHPGSHRGAGFDAVVDQAVSAMQNVLDDTPEEISLIIENSAGMGQHIGSHFREIGKMISALDNDRVKVCLDTQHTFAAGYPITDKDGLEKTMEEFDREIGLDHLSVVHANDSKTPFASGIDRHENIGQGFMGVNGFEVIMKNKCFENVPFLLEVPGMEGNGPDAENINILKSIRETI